MLLTIYCKCDTTSYTNIVSYLVVDIVGDRVEWVLASWEQREVEALELVELDRAVNDLDEVDH